MALPATDAFTNSNGTALATHSSSWTINGPGGLEIQDNACESNSASNDVVAAWNADTFNENHYSQVTLDIKSGGSGGNIGPAVRCAAASTQSYMYFLWPGGNESFLARLSSGDAYTEIASGGDNWAVDDVLKIDAAASNISAYVNGSLDATIGTQTDSTHTGGGAGIFAFDNDTDFAVDNFEGDDLPFGTIIQVATGTAGNSTNATATFAVAPTDNNIVVVIHFTGDGSSNGPSGYTEAYKYIDISNNDALAMYYKIASSEGTGVTATSDASDEQTITIMEIQGPFDSTPLVTIGMNFQSASDNNFGSGTTPDVKVADTIAVVGFGLRTGSHTMSGWTNGFVERSEGIATTTKSNATATLLNTAEGRFETQVVPSSTAIYAGIIAIFQKSGQTPTAYAFGDIVQSVAAKGSGTTTQDVIFPNTPAEDNLLLLLQTSAQPTLTPPTGFTEVVDIADGGNTDITAIHRKIAGSSESSTITMEHAANGSQIGRILEVFGPWETTPEDVTAEDGPAETTSPQTGTTATTSQADEFAVGLIGFRDGATGVGTQADNSFVPISKEQTSGSTTNGQYAATKLLTATGAQAFEMFFDNNDDGVGCIATFKKLADVGTTIPVVIHHLHQQGIA